MLEKYIILKIKNNRRLKNAHCNHIAIDKNGTKFTFTYDEIIEVNTYLLINIKQYKVLINNVGTTIKIIDFDLKLLQITNGKLNLNNNKVYEFNFNKYDKILIQHFKDLNYLIETEQGSPVFNYRRYKQQKQLLNKKINIIKDTFKNRYIL